MIKFDYHIHTEFSDDSTAPLSSMADAALKMELSEIVFTDHCDPDYANPNLTFSPDYEAYHAEISHIQNEYAGRLKIARGIEIGLQRHVLNECRDAAHAYPYDFILASFHCAEKKELIGESFFAGRSPEESFIAFYNFVYDCLKHFKDYSVLGHLNTVERYTNLAPDPGCYMDIVEEILKLIIADGKGIELNTSSFRYRMNRLTPSLEMLKLYRMLGGEILTIGSDAHRPQDIGDHFQFAEDLLKEIGFRYVTTFEQKRPIQNRL